MKNLQQQIKNLNAKQKLAIAFVIYFFIWFLAKFFYPFIWTGTENVSLVKVVFGATFMAVIFTISMHWDLIKAVFSNNKAKQ